MTELRDAYDVVVLGGGLAALSLARLAGLELPGLSVLTLDRGAGLGRKVGESTVEIGAHFLNARLRLGDVLCRTQLPKNGLRFWFDDEERALPFDQASEDGPATYAFWRTFQLERETLEAALLELNRAAGHVHLYDVADIEPTVAEIGAEIGAEAGADAPHRVRFTHEGAAREVSARWLVDATGIASLLGRGQANLRRDERIQHGSCWGWFKGARTPDEFIGANVTRSVCYAPRFLSTNHLCYEGYWFWLIPLASGLYSIGVGYDKKVLKDPPRTADEFHAFVRAHRMTRDIAGDAELVEFGRYENYSYRPERYLSERRVAWIGMAGGFVDPFFSSGIDFIGLGCELTLDAIRREREGRLSAARVADCNRILALLYEHFMLGVRDLYKTFASQELSRIRYRRDLSVYWNIFVWKYLSGRLVGDLEPEYFALVEEALARGGFFSRLMQDTHDRLAERGALRRANRGRYTFNQLGFRNLPFLRFEQKMGNAPDPARQRRSLHEQDTASFLALLDARFDGERSPLRRPLFEAAHAVYPRLLELERAHGFGPAFWDEAFALLTAELRRGLAARGLDLDVRLDPETWVDPLRHLVAACADPDQEKAVRRCFHEPPELHDYDDLPLIRDEVQPPQAWSVEHTPWLEEPPVIRTVYDMLGEAWWRDPKQPMSVLRQLRGGSYAAAKARAAQTQTP